MIKSKKGVYFSDFITILLFFLLVIVIFLLSSCTPGNTDQNLTSEEGLNLKLESQAKLRNVFEKKITEEDLDRVPSFHFDFFKSSFLNKNMVEGVKESFKHYSKNSEKYTEDEKITKGSLYTKNLRQIIHSLLNENTEIPTNVKGDTLTAENHFHKNSVLINFRLTDSNNRYILNSELNDQIFPPVYPEYPDAFATQKIVLNDKFIMEVSLVSKPRG